MRLIPVLDLARGVAVQARGGDRARYGPVVSALVPQAQGDACLLLEAYGTALGARECYVADLDAIQGGDMQRESLHKLHRVSDRFGVSLLLDAGAGRLAEARQAVACGAGQVVVGLETLRAYADLASIVRVLGPGRVIFSLDLRLGKPILHPVLAEAGLPGLDPTAVAARAVDAGVETVLALDVGRVGNDKGVDLALLEALRRRLPSARLLAGGGVRGRLDLDRMRDAGCDGALVASAIHAGRITGADLAAVAGAERGAQSSASTSR